MSMDFAKKIVMDYEFGKLSALKVTFLSSSLIHECWPMLTTVSPLHTFTPLHFIHNLLKCPVECVTCH